MLTVRWIDQTAEPRFDACRQPHYHQAEGNVICKLKITVLAYQDMSAGTARAMLLHEHHSRVIENAGHISIQTLWMNEVELSALGYSSSMRVDAGWQGPPCHWHSTVLK